MAEGTVIIGSLNDKEIKDTIDALVKHVEQGTQKMAQSFDTTVDTIKKKLQELGSTKLDNLDGGSARSSRRSAELKQETAAVKEVTTSYDNMATAIQKASAPKSARDSYYAFVQGYKEQANQIALQIKEAEAGLNRAIENRVTELNDKIARAKSKINELNVELAKQRMDAEKTGNYSMYNPGITRTTQAIEYQMKRIAELQREIANAPNMFGQQKSDIETLRQKHEQVLNTMKEEVTVQQQVTKSVQETSSAQSTAESAAKKVSDETKARMEREWQASQRATEIERERTNAIIQRGAAASEAARKTMESMQAQSALGGKSPITGVQELQEAIRQMRSAYYRMDEEGRKSTFGRELKENMEKAEKAMAAVLAYNKQLAGVKTTSAAVISDIGSYQNLNSVLQRSITTYKRLGVEERNAAQGDELRQKIQGLTRAVQMMRQEMMRPLNLASALNLREDTLDNITYKMQQLASYRSGLNVDTQKDEIKTVNKEYDRLKGKMDDVMQKNKNMISSNEALNRSWSYMKNRLAFYFTVGASTQFIRNLIEVRAQYEMNERALGILIGSAEYGTHVFNELSNMALVSPYTLIELSAAAKQLVAYDIAARDVVDTTRRLADMASAVGVPMERLTYALGQIKAYGYLNSRDARMFANAGIPLVKQLSEHLSELEGHMVSVGDVYARIKKKSIDFEDVMAVITKMTDEGGKFFNFQAKMADTLKVKLANLTLAWNNMLNDIGKETQGFLSFTIESLKKLFLHWKDIDRILKKGAWALGAVTALKLLVYWVVTAGRAMGVWATEMSITAVFGKRLGGIVKSLTEGFRNLVFSWQTWIVVGLAMVAGLVTSLTEGNAAQKEFNKSLREGAKNTYDELVKFSEQYNQLRESLYKHDEEGNKIGTIDISTDDAKKAWEELREQIELSSSASDDYISKLLAIDNYSERLREAFNILDDLKTVSAALKDIDDDTIKITKDWSEWWNLWIANDGLIGNLKDYEDALKKINTQFGSVENAQKAANENVEGAAAAIHDADIALNTFLEDLQVTINSINDFINFKGWANDANKISAAYDSIISKLAEENHLTPQQAFTLQLETEKARTDAMKQALKSRLEDEMAALNLANDARTKDEINSRIVSLKKQYDEMVAFGGRSHAYWRDFTKWMKEQHISEMREMFRNMDAEEISSLNFQEGEYFQWVQRLVDKYAKEHNMAYDSAFNYLKNWVTSANQWSIFIPLVISTEGKKSVFELLSSADSDVENANKKIKRLETRINELNKKTNKTVDETKELTAAENERNDAIRERNNAIERGGHDSKEDAANAKASAAAQRKAAAAAKREQRAAESALQKALKDELQLIDKVRSQYKKLTDVGVDGTTAMTMVTEQFETSIKQINNILGKNGLPLFDIKSFAGTDNPNKVLAMLKAQLDAAKNAKNVKPSELKDLEVKYSEIVVDAKVYNTKKIAEGLNSELGKLKEQYELAVEFDANPELGDVFAAMLGLDKGMLEQLPRDFEKAMAAMQPMIDEQLKGSGLAFNLAENLNKKVFEEWVEANNQEAESTLVKSLDDIRKYFLEMRNEEVKKQTDEWNKLLEKYAEYEYKRNEIRKTYERERDIAIKKGATQDILDAILNKYKQDLANLDFEEFQKTPTWITATGDLAQLTDGALKMFINRIVEYKRKAKDLNPKQIKQINTALKNLRKQLRSGNPFAIIANAASDAKERMDDYEEAIKLVEESIKKLILANIENGNLTEEDEAKLQKLISIYKKLIKEQKEVGKINPTVIVEGINQAIQLAQQATSYFTDMAEAIGGKGMTEAAENIKKTVSVLEQAGQGAAAGAQIGGGWGAVIGAAAGGLSALVTNFADQWSGNKSITKKVEESVREVKRLENAYKDLDHTASLAYGAIVSGAKAATYENKKLELAEKERQLKLEESRSSKNKDEDKILDLKGEIIDLKNEIADSSQEIVNDLLGISSAGDGITGLVDAMIDAFKNGENAMDAFGDKWDEMVDEMIKKLLITTYMQKAWDKLMQTLQEKENEYLTQIAKKTSSGTVVEQWASGLSDFDIIRILHPEADLWKLLEQFENNTVSEQYMREIENYRKSIQDAVIGSTEALDAASIDYTKWAIEYMRTDGRDYMTQQAELLKAALGGWFTAGGDATKNLSALQQGIQGITEDTAGALEAYMNSVSQQVYLQSDLLTQIRDTVIGFDIDVQTASLGQILLQLQASYQVQMSIQGILDGVLNPSGRAFNVELLS